MTCIGQRIVWAESQQHSRVVHEVNKPATAMDTSTAVLVRQVLGVVAHFEKATTVAKLAAARKRKRIANGKCEGRKSLAETRPEARSPWRSC
jgi:DNA invertase Pin-like site-specific DNA recombinase